MFLKNRFKILSLIFASVATMKMATAQDMHFSQYMNAPLYTNPANTGFIPNGDYLAGTNYRTQWQTVMSHPYKTMSLWGETQYLKNNDDYSGWLGFGGYLLHDEVGLSALTSNEIHFSTAYHQLINYTSLLSAGIGVKWVSKSINPANLLFPDQFNGSYFDVHIPTNALITQTKAQYLAISAGLNFSIFPSENSYINFGVGITNLNNPYYSFTTNKSEKNKLPSRYNLFINGSFKMNDYIILNPNTYYSYQYKASEWLIGGNVHINLSPSGEEQLILGMYYRNKDAFIPMAGVDYKGYKITFTYDATASSLSKSNGSVGALEFSLVKEGVVSYYRGNRKQSMCPSFKQ